MGRGLHGLWTCIAAMLAAMLFVAPASAAGAIAPDCIRPLETQKSIEGIVAEAESRACSGGSVQIEAARTLLRFDVGEARDVPTHFRSRIGLFDAMVVAVADDQGVVRSSRWTMRDVTLVSGEPKFMVAFPGVPETTRSVYVLFENASHDATLLHAELLTQDPTAGTAHAQTMLLLAIIVGMMLVPVMFDIAFWTALRDAFLPWHAALTLSFAALVFARSGLVVEFFQLSIPLWRFLLISSLGVAILMATMFTHAFVEEDRLDPRLRRALPWAGGWALAASLFHGAALDVLRPLGGAFHTYALAPVLALFFAVMIDAYRRGSRSIRFQIVGWMPLFAAFTLQLISYIVPIGQPTDALPLFYFGVLSETIATAVGVADRFIVLRRERDRARSRAEAQQTLAERDPLTGVLNRRALEPVFDKLVGQGFTTLALVDLDRFKSINDEYGHWTGDAVLRCAAVALSDDPHVVVVRMGGEEFLLLFRGEGTTDRAERRRRAMTTRIFTQIEGLDRPVTGSMGVVDFAAVADDPNVDFGLVYTRADELLYRAKQAGRNRSVVDVLTLFESAAESKGGATAAA